MGNSQQVYLLFKRRKTVMISTMKINIIWYKVLPRKCKGKKEINLTIASYLSHV